jgi:hypothetical protein
MKQFFCAAGVCLLLVMAPAWAETTWRASSPEQRSLDAAAFVGIDQSITENLTDVQSVAVVI